MTTAKAPATQARGAAGTAPRAAGAGGGQAGGRQGLRERARGVGFQDGARMLSPRGGAGNAGGAASRPGASGSAPAGAGGGVVGRAVASAGRAAGALARQAFVQSGVKGPEDVRAPTGIGGFEVSYDPAAMIEHIRIGGSVEFKNGIEIVDGKAVPGNKELADCAEQINSTAHQNLAILVQEASRWQWTEGDKAAWLARLESVVEAGWDRQFLFHAQPEGWEGQEATTAVDVDVHAGAKGPADHLTIEVYRTPADLSPVRSHVQAGVGGAHDNRMVLGSTDTAGSPLEFGTQPVEFPEGAVDLDPDGVQTLRMWAIRFKGASATPVRVKVHVQGDGERLHDNARERFETIRTTVDLVGFDPERLSFHYAGPGNQAVLQVGNGESQVVARHEFGHAFGLKDEYAGDPGGNIEAGGRRAGMRSQHDDLARSVGLEGSVVENSDSLMSLGTALQPSYGAPFLWALRKVTQMEAWGDTPPARAPSTTGERG